MKSVHRPESVNSAQALPSGAQYFPVKLEDHILFWMKGSHNSKIHCIVQFDGKIDAERLQRAVFLAVEAEPILACRWVSGGWRQYWRSVGDLTAEMLFRIVSTDRPEEDLLRLLSVAEPMDVFKGPQVEVTLFRSEIDRLSIKMNHVVADASGVKDFAYLLAEIYRELGLNSEYRPVPNHSGSRSLRQISHRFNIIDKLKILRRGWRDMASLFFPKLHLITRLPVPVVTKPVFLIRRIDPDASRALQEYARFYQATINDVFSAAFFRSFYSVVNSNPKGQMRLVMTADLRRYLPNRKADAICNLSGFAYLNMGNNRKLSLDEATVRVREKMNRIKKDWIGLGNIPTSAVIFKFLPHPLALWLHDRMSNQLKRQTMAPGLVSPLLTNMNSIAAERLRFGDVQVQDSFLAAPLAFPPVLAISLSSFKDRMTICMGYCEDALDRERMEALLDRIVSDLLSCSTAIHSAKVESRFN